MLSKSGGSREEIKYRKLRNFEVMEGFEPRQEQVCDLNVKSPVTPETSAKSRPTKTKEHRYETMKRPLTTFVASTVSVLMLLSGAAAANTGKIDPQFGENGVQSGPVEAKAITGLTGDKSGQLIMSFTNFTDSFTMQSSRFLSDGAFDLGFGEDGYASSALGRPSASAMDVASGANGETYLVGWKGQGSKGNLGYMAAKFDANGQPVAEFGNTGTVQGSTAANIAFLAAGIQKDGKLVAAGVRDLNNGARPAGVITRFKTNGDVDRSFGGGTVQALLGQRSKGSTGLLNVEVLPNGKILASGYRNDQIAIVRLLANGKRDRSFGGGDGISTRRISLPINCQLAAFCLRSSMTVGASGEIFVLGNYKQGKRIVPRVVKFTKAGKVASNFADRGVLAAGSLGTQDASEVLAGSKGKVIVVGSIGKGIGATQYSKGGKLDRDFGNQGRAFTAAADYSESAVLQGDELTISGHKGLYGTKLIRFR